MYTFDRTEYENRMAWYRRARFGMFIHFGLYAIPARGEWVRSIEKMPEEDYLPFFREFNPTAFDARSWARAAKRAGMRYAVLTAKHHDGFCLFDSALTDFKSTNTPFGRDLVSEFLDAFRAEGLKVGLYYSLLDWHHPDYPHFGDRIHPDRERASQADEAGRDFDRYLDYMHAQVRELCEHYGKLDLMWFDFSYDDMRGEKWRATELASMVRELQPGIILNNRMEVSGEGFGSLAEGAPTPFHGDFVTPEQMIPPHALADASGRPLAWEACMTMNGAWGYDRTDTAFKPADMLVRKLVECVSKNGNMILNVGPDATGRFPDASSRILEGIGAWMERNDTSVVGCGPAEDVSFEYGRVTRSLDDPKTLYFHVYEPTVGPLPLVGLSPESVAGMRLVRDGSQIPVSHSWVHSDYPDTLFVDLGESPVLPDHVDTVVKVVLK